MHDLKDDWPEQFHLRKGAFRDSQVYSYRSHIDPYQEVQEEKEIKT